MGHLAKQQSARKPAAGKPSPSRPRAKVDAEVPNENLGLNASRAPAPRRSTYLEAVALYEQAVRTLQQHNYAKAADLLRHMVATFPEERELIERSRMYLALCERQLEPLTAEPRDTPERLYAATIALNAGKLDDAVAHLERILEAESAHDQALYMLAVAYTEREQVPEAIRYLQQAIEANPENRALARVDPDLDDLRDDDAVAALLEAPPVTRPATEHRRSAVRRK
jgi:tetratricopeptide (TPR) repeat protein